ncbi:MAG TPA: hypothetical protein VLZ50_06520 [Terracidiphilus sp.]|nr:hypothetical protein [Terracidiphilus sp.]
MYRAPLLPIVLVAFTVSALPANRASAQESVPTGLKIRQVPAKVPPMPFPPNSEARDRVNSIGFLPAGQMSEHDKLLEADAESSIQERTRWSDIAFNEGGWNYRQVVCAAFPNHLFLQFTRNSGTGDVTMFSASIPRHGEGRVRIIPIRRRGYSLFSPAPINAMTISAFNHIRAEEEPAKTPDWLETGLCYAALAGAHPETVLLPDSDPGKFPAPLPATMQIPKQGGAVIRFADVAASPRPMLWTLMFNGKGKLLKATHAPAPLITAKAVPQRIEDVKGKPVPQTIVDLNAPSAQ